MTLTQEQTADLLALHVGDDGAWIELKTPDGKHFTFQPIQQWGPDSLWRDSVLNWCRAAQEATKHRHCAGKVDIDVCEICGKSFRDPIHIRL